MGATVGAVGTVRLGLAISSTGTIIKHVTLVPHLLLFTIVKRKLGLNDTNTENDTY